VHGRNDLDTKYQGSSLTRRTGARRRSIMSGGVEVEEELVAGEQMKPNQEPRYFKYGHAADKSLRNILMTEDAGLGHLLAV
jgi:hypothetical protein